MGQSLEVGTRMTHSVTTSQPTWTGLQTFSQGMTLKCAQAVVKKCV